MVASSLAILPSSHLRAPELDAIVNFPEVTCVFSTSTETQPLAFCTTALLLPARPSSNPRRNNLGHHPRLHDHRVRDHGAPSSPAPPWSPSRATPPTRCANWTTRSMNLYMDSLHTALPGPNTLLASGGKVLHYHGEQNSSRVPTGGSVHYMPCTTQVRPSATSCKYPGTPN